MTQCFHAEPSAPVKHLPSLDLFICSSLQGDLRSSMPLSFPLGKDDASEETVNGGANGCAVLKSLLQILSPVEPTDSFQLWLLPLEA